MPSNDGSREPGPAGQEDDVSFEFHRSVSDEQYAELVDSLQGEKVVGLALWEGSLADDEDEEIDPEQRDVFDFDLYLENQLYLELYAVYLFTDPDEDPLRGLEQIGTMFSRLIEDDVWLDEIAVTQDDELVLVLSRHHQPQLYLNVGGWTLSEWETLPEEE